jgi:hypothetical protein
MAETHITNEIREAAPRLRRVGAALTLGRQTAAVAHSAPRSKLVAIVRWIVPLERSGPEDLQTSLAAALHAQVTHFQRQVCDIWSGSSITSYVSFTGLIHSLLTAASTCTPWKSCDANNGRVVSVGTATSDAVCGCEATFFLMSDGITCAPCSACSDGLTMITPCMSASDTVCGLVIPCVSTVTGIAAKCVYPQGCFACSTAQLSSSSSQLSVRFDFCKERSCWWIGRCKPIVILGCPGRLLLRHQDAGLHPSILHCQRRCDKEADRLGRICISLSLPALSIATAAVN